MRLFTSVAQGSLLLFVLVISSTNVCKGNISEEEDLAALTLSNAVRDLLSMESTESKVYALPASKISDRKPEESKTILKFSSLRKLTPAPSYEIKLQNVSKEDYKVFKWYSVPKDENKKKVINSKDLTAQSSSYPEGYSDHYHDDYPSDQSPETYPSYHYKEEPAETGEYKKPRKKVRKPCTRNKSKKSETRPESSDTTIVHSRSKDGMEYSSHYHNSEPRIPSSLPSTYYEDLMKMARVPLGHVSTRISGQHLHGIPKFDALTHMHKEEGNHFHLHNHQHIYGADGKKIEVAPKSNSYATVLAGLGSLRNMMSSLNSDSLYPKMNLDSLKDILAKTAIGPLNQNLGNSHSGLGGYDSGGIGSFKHDLGSSHSSFNGHNSGEIGPLNHDSGNSHSSVGSYESGEKTSSEYPKKGYHYTGPHKSYGRKTYRRYKNGQPTESSELGPNMDGNIGAEMYKYGLGQYATDEYHDSKSHYPNEVSYAIDKEPYNNDGYGNNHNDHKDDHHDSYGNSKDPHPSYHSDHPHHHSDHAHHDSNLDYPAHNHGPKDSVYSPGPEGKAPYTPPDYDSPGPSNFESNRYSSHNSPIDSHAQEGYHDSPNGHHDSPNGHRDHDHSAEFHGNLPVSHSTSYSGGVEEIPYDPAKEHLYKNMKPDPDPLTLPKNARIVEHHIRLHPKYFAMYRQPVVDIETHANYPVPVHKQFTQTSYPLPVPRVNYPVPLPVPRGNYPVPFHKLIPNPLNQPAPVIPRAPIALPSNLNHMLHAYQHRSLYHNWW